jgi:molybdopterin-guanine dinucleotide biosynthesis adapter protein
MIPIVSIVGKSNSGKTTLIERLIPELTGRGYRVGTIKHNIHGFQIDHEGKDSWRHKQAGARMTVIASPHQVAVIEDVKKDYDLAELRDRYIRDVDVIISEGFKKNQHPKIEVYRTAVRQQMLCGPEDNLVAVTGDVPPDAEIPHFALDNIKGLADFIEARFLTNAV